MLIHEVLLVRVKEQNHVTKIYKMKKKPRGRKAEVCLIYEGELQGSSRDLPVLPFSSTLPAPLQLGTSVSMRVEA